MTTPGPHIDEILEGAPRNWGRWGDDDEIGAINHLAPAEALRGITAVRTGQAVPLGMEINRPGGDPAIAIRGRVQKLMSADKGHFLNGHLAPLQGLEYADDAVFMFLQASTHIDALGHVWYNDQLYNGYDASTTIGGLRRCSVKPLADHGIVGRGVLIDVAGRRGQRSLGDGEQITFAELMDTARAQGTEIVKRDIVLIRTGRINRFLEEGIDAYLRGGMPGITDEPELIDWFRDMEIPTFGSDTVTSEQSISSVSGGRIPLHGALMVNLGIPFMELLYLEDLGMACAADGRYEFMFVCSPLRIHGATGSPINPLAIR